MGMGLPRRLASWKAVRSNQSSSSSAKYRMALGIFGKSRTARRPHSGCLRRPNRNTLVRLRNASRSLSFLSPKPNK
jgi:hypothetical protein